MKYGITETPDSQSRSFGEGKQSGGYSDPSEAFPGAPVDRKFDEPGYGQDAQSMPSPSLSLVFPLHVIIRGVHNSTRVFFP